MAIASVGDLLDKAAKSEIAIEDYYARLRDETKDEGVRLLTYNFSRHRRHLEDALSSCQPARLKRIRSVLLKHAVEFSPESEHGVLGKPAGDVNGKQLLEAAIQYDEGLAGFYRRILEQPLTGEARELFESLIRVEERDIVMLKKMLAMDYF